MSAGPPIVVVIFANHPFAANARPVRKPKPKTSVCKNSFKSFTNGRAATFPPSRKSEKL